MSANMQTFPASACSSTGSSRRVTSMSLSMITIVPSGSSVWGNDLRRWGCTITSPGGVTSLTWASSRARCGALRPTSSTTTSASFPLTRSEFRRQTRPGKKRSSASVKKVVSGRTLEEGAAVVQLDHLNGAGRGGVQAQPAQHALVQVLLRDLHAGLRGDVDVDGAGLGQLRGQLGVAGDSVVDFDADERAVAPHAATPIRSL